MLEVAHIDVGYGATPLLRDVSLRISPGECVLLCGANGSGKTTLLRLLAADRKDAALVPARIPKVGGFTLRAFIRAGCYRELSPLGRLSPQRETELDRAMQRLGIAPLAERDIATLSDGEFQKGCLATALLRRAETLLLDEPTAFLDVDSRMMVLRTLQDLSADHAVLFSSHDIREAAEVSTRILGITRDGRLADTDAGISREQLFNACFERL